MSYWIYLRDPEGNCYDTEPHTQGGTYEVGGCDVTEVNVTYNYCSLFPFRELSGQTAGDTIPLMAGFLEMYGHCRPYEGDYWADTPGNVAKAVKLLHSWAMNNPDGVWYVH